MSNEKKNKNRKKEILLKTIGEIVREKRQNLNKGILLLSYEYDIPNTSLAQLEKGNRDVQISTLWKLAEALGMNFSSFVKEIENRLPKNFKITED